MLLLLLLPLLLLTGLPGSCVSVIDPARVKPNTVRSLLFSLARPEKNIEWTRTRELARGLILPPRSAALVRWQEPTKAAERRRR